MVRCGARPSTQARFVGLGVSLVLSVGVGLGVPAVAFGAEAEPAQVSAPISAVTVESDGAGDLSNAAVADVVQDELPSDDESDLQQKATAQEVAVPAERAMEPGNEPSEEVTPSEFDAVLDSPKNSAEEVSTPEQFKPDEADASNSVEHDAVQPTASDGDVNSTRAENVGSATGLELQSFATAAQSETSFGVADKMNVYRLYNPRNGEHLYTRDLYEAKTIASEQGWQWEGVGFTASSTTGQAVWRLYERASGLHLWTTDANERRVLLAGRKGWDDEGLAWYGAGPYRLSRLYDPASGQHLYTRDANEVSLLTGQRGWRLEDGAGTWDTGSASDYVPVEPQWLVSDSWGVAGGRYWIQADGSIAHDRYLAPAEGTGYGYNVYATSTGAMLRDDATRIDGVLTAANKDGRLIPITSSISLNVPYTNQYDEGAPMGCEGAGLYMALRAKGYIPNMTYRQFMGTMPYAPDGNPYHGFIGSPWPGYDPYEYNGMLMGGVAKWGARYAPVEDLTGCGEGTLVAELAQGNPLVVWVSPRFKAIYPRNEWYGKSASTWHVMTLMGYNPTTREFQVSDPANSKRQYWVGWNTYTRVWEVLRGAVVVR